MARPSLPLVITFKRLQLTSAHVNVPIPLVQTVKDRTLQVLSISSRHCTYIKGTDTTPPGFITYIPRVLLPGHKPRPTLEHSSPPSRLFQTHFRVSLRPLQTIEPLKPSSRLTPLRTLPLSFDCGQEVESDSFWCHRPIPPY